MKEHIKHLIKKRASVSTMENGEGPSFVLELKHELMDHGYSADDAMQLIGECLQECMKEGPDES